MTLRATSAIVGLLLSSSGHIHGQSPFFCEEYPNNGFDCAEHGNIFDPLSVTCPDPLIEPWCACLKTYMPSAAPNKNTSIVQEVLYRQGQPTAGTYSVDVTRGTLDLSGIGVGDIVFDFVICVDGSAINEIEPSCAPDCPPFHLDFQGVVTAVSEDSAEVELRLPADTNLNPINVGVLNYDPVDETHSFGLTYLGTLTGRGPGKGFTFEYHLYEPDPESLSPFRGIQDGDLDDPNFTVEALLIIADAELAIYWSPPCGKVAVGTSITPKVPVDGFAEEKEFETIFDFGGGDFTLSIGGSTTAEIGGSVLLTATTDAAEPPSYAWEVAIGTADLTDNGDGTASVTSTLNGSVTVRLTGTACSTSKTAEIVILFGQSGGLQKPGDSNQDGKLDISDPVDTLGFLFLGTKGSLPCGDGEAGHPANLALLDVNGDGGIDLSDPVYLLNFLFTGGAEPVNCLGDTSCPCRVIDGCPASEGCR